jgi:hypothetical protein
MVCYDDWGVCTLPVERLFQTHTPRILVFNTHLMFAK